MENRKRQVLTYKVISRNGKLLEVPEVGSFKKGRASGTDRKLIPLKIWPFGEAPMPTVSKTSYNKKATRGRLITIQQVLKNGILKIIRHLKAN